jgi:hypothetical protein
MMIVYVEQYINGSNGSGGNDISMSIFKAKVAGLKEFGCRRMGFGIAVSRLRCEPHPPHFNRDSFWRSDVVLSSPLDHLILS